MKREEINLMVAVCKMYYEENYTQEEIADKKALSRPKVSRLIAKARELGFVKVSVLNPYKQATGKEFLLKEKFGLKECKVIPCDSDENAKAAAGRYTADILNGIIKSGDIIGIDFNSSIVGIADYIKPDNVKGITVVRLKGIASKKGCRSIYYGAAENFAKVLGSDLNCLPVPVIVDSHEAKKRFLQESSVKYISDLGKKANIAISCVGFPKKDYEANNWPYSKTAEFEKLCSSCTGGEIFGRFYNIDGSITNEEFNGKNTSLELSELRKKDYSIGVACEENAYSGLLGAIKGGYVNCIVTDEKTADELIEYRE